MLKKMPAYCLSEQMAHLLDFIGCIFPLLNHKGISHLQVGWGKIVKILFHIFISLFMPMKVAKIVDLSSFLLF
jgi:hypothetical protein